MINAERYTKNKEVDNFLPFLLVGGNMHKYCDVLLQLG